MTNQEYIELHPEQFKDEIDKWLFTEFSIIGGSCSAQGCMEYSVARKVAEKMQEQWEENRLKHCDELTPQEAQIESDFVTEHLKKNNRTPTFIDAIKYGQKQMIDKACDYIKKDWWQMLVYDVNCYGGNNFNLEKTIQRFRKSMEE